VTVNWQTKKQAFAMGIREPRPFESDVPNDRTAVPIDGREALFVIIMCG